MAEFACPYVLCPRCLPLRDWATDPVVRTQGRVNRERYQTNDPRTHRCTAAEREGVNRPCRKAINPMLCLCRGHGEALGLCQHCMKRLDGGEDMTITPDEATETIIDAFTVLVKTYGLTVSVGLLEERLPELPPEMQQFHADAASSLDDDGKRRTFLERIDGRQKRPIWSAGLGSNTRNRRFCESCTSPRYTGAIFAPATCGHWTAGSQMAACIICSAEHSACERCGTSLE
ncbi:MAG: hypothetical protein WC866_02685 [Patescibacteria group bacterium]